MENVVVSTQYRSTSTAVPSPTASYVACLSGARLQIQCLTTFEIVRNIAIPSSHDLKSSKIVWSPPTTPLLPSAPSRPSSTSTPPRRPSRPPQPYSNRILVYDDDTTRVYDLRDEKWNAVISNGSGGMGKNVHVEFGATEDEVLVWSDFTSCIKIWCLKTGRVVEIRDPKFPGKEGRGWGYRPVQPTTASTGGARAGGRNVLALLCRAAGSDILLLLAPGTYTVLNRVELPTTDVAGLKWSRDGRWLAIWDAASTGEWDVEGLGVKTLEWIPGNERLAVGGWDRRVRILSTRTFAPIMFLDHTPVIDVPTAPVYSETIDNTGARSYMLTPQPVTPPKAPLDKNDTGLLKHGIGLLCFNANGSMCATRDDSTPCTVWIWDLCSLRPKCIAVQYSPVKALLWHPDHAGRLLIRTAREEAAVYLFTDDSVQLSSSQERSQTAPSPEILSLSSHMRTPKPTSVQQPPQSPYKFTTSWLPTPPHKKPAFFFAHESAYVVVWPEGKDAILRFKRSAATTTTNGDSVGGVGEIDVDNEGEGSDDSLYEILTGRTNRWMESAGASGVLGRSGDGGEGLDVDVDGEEGEEFEFESSVGTVRGLDDTFRGKRGVREPRPTPTALVY
ncbi:Qor, NADPH:quinone reductase [Pyrenophora tritici-repentis]|nr:Qor, NADPH:quinone reductase [Pyrenophora tritici-repentis]